MQLLMETDWRSFAILVQQVMLTVTGIGVVRFGLRRHLKYADKVVFNLKFRPAYGNNGWVTWASYGLMLGIVMVVAYTLLAQ